MMTATPPSHIHLDDRGVAWIDDTGVKVVEIIADHTAYGHAPEEIQRNHPDLTLAQVYAAFSFYHDHREELDAELERRYARAEALRERATPFPSREELLARRKPA